MEKVILRPKEQLKYEIIKKLVETNGNKKRASVKLNCTVRNIDLLVQVYKTKGKAGFVHGNRGRKPAISIPDDLRIKIEDNYIDNYKDCNMAQYSEIVQEDFGIQVSSRTLIEWMKCRNILSPKARRKTKKELKKKLKNELNKSNNTAKETNVIKEMIETLDYSMAHPRRPRSKYAGELIQMDASEHYWIPNEKWHLHVAIDDASGEITGAYFDKQETLNGYYHVFYDILINHGIPNAFLTDRRTVFEYKQKRSILDEDDTFTQFAYACKQLGVDIKTTSVPQSKGRIERLNQTLQSRLPIELRRHNIQTIEEANEFLKTYIQKFNEQFALEMKKSQSVYENAPDHEELMKILAILSERVIDNGHCIKFKNQYYIPVNSDSSHVHLLPKTKCMVIESFDKKLYCSVSDMLYGLEKIDKHKKISKDFDIQTKEEKKKKTYIPPMNHPWRRSSFVNFRNTQKHRIQTTC